MSSENNKRLPSLRKRYLTLAALVISLLIAGAGTASWYINNITSNNRSALDLNKSITATIHSLRHALSLINMTVNAMLINPKTTHETVINRELERALHLIKSLQENSELNRDTTQLIKPIRKLYLLFNDLNQKTIYLTQQRKKADWVYPALPYINNKLLVPNNNFLSSAETALNGYQLEDLEIDDTFHEIHKARYLWQNKILNFRAVIIRFAGLNKINRTSQEIAINNLQIEIDNLLQRLLVKSDNDELELHVESALKVMIAASTEWGIQWKSVQKIRTHNDWRRDISYLNQHIIPLREKINSATAELETLAHDWSLKQTENLSDAAQKIIAELWLLILLAISFVIVVYIMIERLVLQPTYRLATYLTSNDNQSQYSQIHDDSSEEINQLTSAFNSMQKQIQQRQIELEHQAMHDALTGLPNRLLFNDRLTQAINIMHRSKERLAVLLLDLDRFKDVNDTLGHHIGDLLLQQASTRLQTSIRASDTVARLGGDEFAIIAPQTSAEEALDFADKVVASLNNIFTIEHNNIHVGVSIGISIFPDNGKDNHTLVRHADTAMYGAKYTNRSALLYSASQDKNTPDNLTLVSDLHRAVEEGKEFSIHYQPQIDLKTERVTKVEALFRWHQNNKDLIPTQEAISLAEKTGVIQQLTIWVLNTAIEEYMRYLFGKDITLSINLSTWNLQDPDLPSTLEKLLSHHNMPAKNLTLEITETAIMHNPVNARSILNEINEMGVILSIDDYGTGFSSLSYLKLLPVHELKIDKSFIFDMSENENDAIIVKSTIEMAHNLGYKTIAEGVEDYNTLILLKDLNCDIAQGYHISKPISIDQLLIWLMKHS